MDEKRLKQQIEDEDFIIRVRPFTTEEGNWTGEVDISIIAFPDNPLDDVDYDQVMHFAKMMCASVPVMEQAKEIREIIHDYVMSVIDNETEFTVDLEEQTGVEKSYDGNVVHLNFNTKTGGSA